MALLNNKEKFSDRLEIYNLLTELETACASTDILAPVKVHVLLGKLKTLNITFKTQEENNETITKKALTENETNATIN